MKLIPPMTLERLSEFLDRARRNHEEMRLVGSRITKQFTRFKPAAFIS